MLYALMWIALCVLMKASMSLQSSVELEMLLQNGPRGKLFLIISIVCPLYFVY